MAALLVIGSAGTAQAAKKLRAPAPQAPAAAASVETLPTFTWQPVKGAVQYDFQLSDDEKFNSIVLGKGKGGGSQRTRNTAVTLEKTVPNGNYFWRVRAITAKDAVGAWSAARTLTKDWKTVPALEGPADEFAVSWPSLPLLLRWSPVKHATKYIVTIAADPTLAQLVGTPSNKPAEVPGTAFALQGTLPSGRYYWAITPVDAGGLRGTRSRVGTFTWSWPTSTSTGVVDLNETPQVFDPQLNWAPVAGAARYEVEINPDDDFAAGSRVCCKDPIIGTALSPVRILPNNNDVVPGSQGYHWRVRAYDVDGNPGQWNRGPLFDKAYDNVTPTVTGLHLRDYDKQLTPDAGTVTPGPVFAWDPVPGAAQYHVQWTAFDGTNCGWTNASGPVKTAATAWTPLSYNDATGVPGGIGITPDLRPNGADVRSGRAGQPFGREIAFPGFGILPFLDDITYCVRVRALSDDSFRENDNLSSPVPSEWTQLGGGENQPAFTYQAPSNDPVPSPVPQLPAPIYRDPISGGPGVTRTPLLRWNPVPGAQRYYVLIARDSNFTTVIDAAFTAMTSYAPNWVLEDEATSYYWAVIPSARADGSGISAGPKAYNPQRFNKFSIAPGTISPVAGVDVTAQPTFRWTPAEAAQKYRLQVSADPQFGDLLDDVLTSSTAYTSSTPYPVDTALYWRVRAEQLQVLRGTTIRVELNWSEVGSFRRLLTPPVLGEDIPLRGELPPPLIWTPVPGAISYDFRIDQPDGKSNDFNVRSAAGTFSKLSGIGTFSFRVRANFATRTGAIASAFSPPRPFTRLISPPSGPRVTASKTRLVFGWTPAAAATKYKVQVSTTESFARVIDSVSTLNTSWAPALTSPLYKGSGPLYWRVATVDDGNNVGAFVSGRVRTGKQLTVRIRGRLRRNASSRITVSVRGAGKALRSASVRASGAGVRSTTKRTGKRGTASLRLRPTKRGSATVLVTRSGYADKTVTVRVR